MCPTQFVMLFFRVRKSQKVTAIEVGEAFLNYKPEQKLQNKIIGKYDHKHFLKLLKVKIQ